MAKNKTLAFDLTDVRPEDIARFRNLAIANVIQPMIGGDELASHDRHYSNHSKDKTASFLLTAEEVTIPNEMFGSIEGLKEIAPEEFLKRIR